MEETDLQIKDIAGEAKAIGTLTKNLPGMVNTEDAETAESETCPTCKQKVCPTCKQTIVTSEPQNSGGVDINQALQTTESAMNCCSKAFDCFGKVSGAFEE